MYTAEESVEDLVENGYLTPKLGREVLRLSKEERLTPDQVCDKHGFWLCDHNPDIDRKLDNAVRTAAVWSMDPGKLLGVVMNALQGQANPQVVRDRISKEIDRRNSKPMFDLAMEDIHTIEDNRILDELCKNSDSDGR